MNSVWHWLGIVAVVVWGVTFVTAASMMWHPDWMYGDPWSEKLTVSLHLAAAILGLCLPALLAFAPVRRRLNVLHMLSYLLAFGLALATLLLLLNR